MVPMQAGKQQWALNRIVGRSAHIEFIESDLYVRFLLWTLLLEKRLLGDSDVVDEPDAR